MSSHDQVLIYHGSAEWLIELQDAIHRGLPEADKTDWPRRLASAAPVGKNIESVRHELMVHIQRQMLPKYFNAKKFPDVAQSIEAMAALHERAARGDEVDQTEWSAAKSAAAAAARSAAELARSAWTGKSARSAWTACSAAEAAALAASPKLAWSAVESAVESAAWSADWSAWEELSDTLIRLLEAV